MSNLPLPMTDESLMPFGKFKGKKLADVPDYYLLWCWENIDLRDPLKTYIWNNLDAIKANITNKQRKEKSQ